MKRSYKNPLTVIVVGRIMFYCKLKIVVYSAFQLYKCLYINKRRLLFSCGID